MTLRGLYGLEEVEEEKAGLLLMLAYWFGGGGLLSIFLSDSTAPPFLHPESRRSMEERRVTDILASLSPLLLISSSASVPSLESREWEKEHWQVVCSLLRVGQGRW